MRNPYGFELSQNCTTCKFRGSGFFCQLSPIELKEFDGLKFVSAYPSGAILFVEEQEARGVYVVCEGQVKLFFHSNEGKTIGLRIAEPGEILGLFSALTGKPYEVTAVTLRPCQVAFVFNADFQYFLGKHLRVFQRVAGQMSLEYKAACEQVNAVGLGATLSQRVATFLLIWSTKTGAPDDGMPFTLPMTHEKIAEHLGMARESATRAFGALRRHGLIAVTGSTLVIPDRAALERFRSFPAEHERTAGPHLVRLTPSATNYDLRQFDARMRKQIRGQNRARA